MNTKNITVSDAIASLRPGAHYILINNDLNSIEWNESPIWEGGQKKPTREEVEAEIVRLQKEWEDTEYQRLRAVEYPPITDYLDGLVKGNQDQMKAYIDACLAVKAKYPKPTLSELQGTQGLQGTQDTQGTQGLQGIQGIQNI
jgi:hypothetical protein